MFRLTFGARPGSFQRGVAIVVTRALGKEDAMDAPNDIIDDETNVNSDRVRWVNDVVAVLLLDIIYD
jgi:hypothetical protein